MKRRNVLLLLLPLLFYQSLVAQVTLQVFTKSNSIVMDAQALKKIQLSAEKATIEVHLWNQPKIKVDYRIKAKHPTKEIAQQDLGKMKLIHSASSGVFYIRNYIEIEKNQTKPVSNFDVEYKIYLPASVGLVISNSFGDLLIPYLSGALEANLKFCTVKIDNIQAKCEIESHYGKLFMKNIHAETSLSTNYTAVVIENIQSKFNLTAQFGSIDIVEASAKFPINLKTTKSKIVFQNNLVASKSTKIIGVGANLKLPSDFTKTKESGGKSTWEIISPTAKTIELICNYGTLNYIIR